MHTGICVKSKAHGLAADVVVVHDAQGRFLPLTELPRIDRCRCAGHQGAGLGPAVPAAAVMNWHPTYPLKQWRLSLFWPGWAVFPMLVKVSAGQRRLWFLDRLHGAESAYIMPRAFRLSGRISTDALARSIEALVARHESFRTRFEFHDGEPLQRIDESMRVPVVVRPVPDRAELSAALKAAAAAPFDLSTGPLLRVFLYALSEDEHVLLLVMHHIISDGWSMGVLYRDLSALYEAECSGREAVLAPLPLQYTDYTLWQREWLTGDRLERELDYWLDRLAGVAPVLELPTDRPRPKVRSGRGGQVRRRVSPGLLDGLRGLSRSRRCTLFMTLLSVFQVLLYRYTGREDIVVGMPTARSSSSGV